MKCAVCGAAQQLVCGELRCGMCYERAMMSSLDRRSRPSLDRRVPGDTPLGHSKFRGYGPK